MHPAAGGPPVVVDRLSTYAAAFHWDASVLTTSLMCEDDGRRLATDLGGHLDIEVLPIDRPRIMGHASRAKAAMDAAVRNANIVHIHTLWHPLNTIARRACEQHHKPYVLSPHGMLDPYSMGVHAWRKRLYLALAERRNLTNAARVVFTTASEMDLAKQTLALFVKGEIVPLGADQPPGVSRTELAANFLKTHPGGVDGQRILFLSRLHPKKGLELLLTSMVSVIASNPKAHLFIVGSGTKDYEARLRRVAEKLSLKKNVTFTGFLTGEAKWSAMATADIFVLPSRQENFGIAIVDAMHASLPVVVSRNVNISSEIAKASAGIVLVDAEDIEAIANAIRQFVDDPTARKLAGENARKLASINYSWSGASKRCYALYEEVLNEIASVSKDGTSTSARTQTSMV
jgi:glycosyltransferase involved in cell wall biosynthesis